MAYTSFQNCTKQEYENVIYSQQAEHKLKIFFNNIELQDADTYCEKFTRKPRIVPNGAKAFSLNNFISQEAELILRDIDTSIIQDQVNISIGTLVNNTYEYVPIGIFNIEDQPTTDKNKTTIKLRDNSVKFDFNYNAEPLITENGGSATKLQILQDICSQANVTCNITSFIGYLDEVGIYDNSITARQYIANIAEQAGKIATINREGELIFIDLNQLTTWEMPLEVVEKYEVGTSYKIGKIVYEDGIVRHETEDSNDDTLFLDASNDYIDNSNLLEQATNNNNYYELENTANEPLKKFELEGKTEQENNPSPNNPSELVSVGYQNIFNKSATFNNASAVKSEIDTGVRITETTAGTYKYAVLELGRENLLGKTITISSNVLVSGQNVAGIYLYWGNSSNLAYQYLTGMSVTGEAVITKIIPTTMPSGADRLNLLLYANTNGTANVNDYANYEEFQIEYSDKKHSYIPYGKYGIEVVNKNLNLLKNITKQTGTSKGVTFTLNDDGSYTLNGQNDGTGHSQAFLVYTGDGGLKIPAGTYYTLTTGYDKVTITGYDGTSYKLFASETSNSFTLNADTTFTLVYIQVFNGDTTQYNNHKVYPIISKVPIEVSDYQPYTSNTQLYVLDEPLRSIGDTKDKLYIENGTLKVERNIRHVELAVANMNNNEEYPGWTNFTETTQMKNDYPNENTLLDYVCDYNCNIGVSSEHKVSINTNGNGIIFFPKNYNNNLTQTQWKTNYPYLIFELDYVVPEPIEEPMGGFEMPSTFSNQTYITIGSNINTTSYIEYLENITRLDAILQEVNQFSIDSFKTGKILGNPAIDGYDLIQITDEDNTYKTLATNDFTYDGVCTSTYDTQIGEEAKEQNVTFNGEETFKKWARTKIDNVEGTLILQAGEIDTTNGRIDSTDLTVSSQGVMINVLSNNSNIDITYDEDGTPLSGEVTAVKTRNKKYSMDENGFKIESSDNSFKLMQNETGAYYYDGDTPTGEYTKDGSKQKDLSLFGTYKYGMADYNSTALFVGQLYENNGEQGFGHFWNGGDINGS